MTPLEHALAYAARGWRVHPIPPGEKYPKGHGRWQDNATTDPERITKYYTINPDHGVCIATGQESGLFAVDIDPDDGGDDSLRALEAQYGPLPETVESLTGGGGRHLLFRWPDQGDVRNSASGVLGVGIDVRGTGGQIVAAPTIHPNGMPYTWEIEHDPLDGIAVADAPGWLLEMLQADPTATEPRRPKLARLAADGVLPGDWWASRTTWPDELVRHGWALHSTHSDASGGYYELWTRPGKTIREGASASLYYRGSDVLTVFSSNAAPLAAESTYSLWGFHVAMEHGNDFAAAASAVRTSMRIEAGAASVPTGASTGNPTTNEGPMTSTTDTDERADEQDAPSLGQPYTDLGNTRRMVADHGHDLRYAPQWGTWLVWEGARWREDITGEANRRAKAVVDGMLTQMATITDDDARKALFKWWQRSQGAARIDAMVHLSRTEPGIPVRVDEMDGDPWLLNTASGAVDLRTGEIHDADRRAMVTKLAPVEVRPGSACPTWEWFIDWAMQGDHELVEFVRRAVGYSLTGTVGEQCLFFLHGGGANGKSTFLSVLQRMMGDYAASAEPDLLLATTNERHPAGVADLLGRRLVIVQEADEGRRLAEATVKLLTGGDTIKARRMRENFFEFRPTHKLWMAANHRPSVRGTDHAIWRRIRMIPFLAQVSPDDQDPTLLDRLLAEMPGILQWAIAGCHEWAQGGLRPPPAVLAATQEYRTEQDHVGRFLDECCTIADGLAITARDLRTAYEAWCTENGERAWSAKAMAPHLVDRGCEPQRGGGGTSRFWRGLALTGEAADDLRQRLNGSDWGRRASGDATFNERDASRAADDSGLW